MKIVIFARSSTKKGIQDFFKIEHISTALAMFGCSKEVCAGLRRRPTFVSGERAIHCIAKNAYAAGKIAAETGNNFKEFQLDYTGFAKDEGFHGHHIDKVISGLEPKRRLRAKTTPVHLRAHRP